MSSQPALKPVLSFPLATPGTLVCEDIKSKALLDRIRLLAPSEATILVTGETGTGKELVARHVHWLSRRSQGPFVAVNCGALSETLVESELFGHEKGSFTGAQSASAGWFETARGGSLFLDEIGDLPLPMQVKLLRVLQERQVVRLGSRTPIPIDVRMIAATNIDLQTAVAQGHFREDLFYRLNVASVRVPPLRERRLDILPLARHFLQIYANRIDKQGISLAHEAEDELIAHSWPGNIRELENVIHQGLLVCRDHTMESENLNLDFSTGQTRPGPVISTENDFRTALFRLFERQRPDTYAHIDSLILRTAFEYCHRNQLQTARLLGISRNIVRARLLQYGEIGAGTFVSRRSS